MTPEAERNTLAAHWVAYLAHNPEGDLAQERRVALARAYIAAGQFEDAAFALEPAARSGFLEATRLLSKLRLGAEATRSSSVPPAPISWKQTSSTRKTMPLTATRMRTMHRPRIRGGREPRSRGAAQRDRRGRL